MADHSQYKMHKEDSPQEKSEHKISSFPLNSQDRFGFLGTLINRACVHICV